MRDRYDQAVMRSEEALAGGAAAPQAEELEQEIESLRREARTWKLKAEKLQAEIEDLMRRLYGRRSERFVDPNQRDLFESGLLKFEEEGTTAPEPADPPKEEEELLTYKRRRPKRRGPKPLPDHLPRDRVEIDPPESERVCACCHEPMVRTGETVTEELEIIPPQFRVKQIVRGKWGCPKDMNGTIQAPLPPRPIEKGRPSPRLLAYVVVSKYCDHLPLYRQEQIFRRQGIELPRSTMDSWLGELSGLLLPIVAAQKKQILKQPVLQADETPILIQDRTSRKMRRGYLWAIGPPWAEVVYEVTLSRSAKWLIEFLRPFGGVLQTDGYPGYHEVVRTLQLVAVACMAHIRRKFYEGRDAAPDEVNVILSFIRALYRVEADAREANCSAAERLELRQERSAPIFGELRGKVDALAPRATPQSKLGKAVSYAEGCWDSMARYLEIGAVEIDNNGIENAMRPPVIGRKNYLFLGSLEGGGERASVFYSLIQTCRRLGIEPFEYLVDVIERVSTHPASRVLELTPRGWKEARERSV